MTMTPKRFEFKDLSRHDLEQNCKAKLDADKASPTSYEFHWRVTTGVEFSRPPVNAVALVINAKRIQGSARVLDEEGEHVFEVGLEVEDKGYQVLLLIDREWKLFTQDQVDLAWVVAT